MCQENHAGVLNHQSFNFEYSWNGYNNINHNNVPEMWHKPVIIKSNSDGHSRWCTQQTFHHALHCCVSGWKFLGSGWGVAAWLFQSDDFPPELKKEHHCTGEAVRNLVYCDSFLSITHSMAGDCHDLSIY